MDNIEFNNGFIIGLTLGTNVTKTVFYSKSENYTKFTIIYKMNFAFEVITNYTKFTIIN